MLISVSTSMMFLIIWQHDASALAYNIWLKSLVFQSTMFHKHQSLVPWPVLRDATMVPAAYCFDLHSLTFLRHRQSTMSRDRSSRTLRLYGTAKHGDERSLRNDRCASADLASSLHTRERMCVCFHSCQTFGWHFPTRLTTAASWTGLFPENRPPPHTPTSQRSDGLLKVASAVSLLCFCGFHKPAAEARASDLLGYYDRKQPIKDSFHSPQRRGVGAVEMVHYWN